MPVLQLNSIKDTSLWSLLNTGFSGAEEEVAKKLGLNLIDICSVIGVALPKSPEIERWLEKATNVVDDVAQTFEI